jgi:hypothetical protein
VLSFVYMVMKRPCHQCSWAARQPGAERPYCIGRLEEPLLQPRHT